MEFTNKDDGFWSGCVGLDAFVFYVGCGWGKKLVLHWAKFLKELGLTPLHINICTTQDVFCKFIFQMLKFWKIKTKMVEPYIFK